MKRSLMDGGMMEAVRLTRRGDLAGATALIQRRLGGGPVGAEAPAYGAEARGPVAVRRVVAGELPESTAEGSREAAGSWATGASGSASSATGSSATGSSGS